MELRRRHGRTCTRMLVSRREVRHGHDAIAGRWTMLIRIAGRVRIAEIRTIAVTACMLVTAEWWLANAAKMIGGDAGIVIAVNRDAGARRIDRVVIDY
jgi:hypothetical protein